MEFFSEMDCINQSIVTLTEDVKIYHINNFIADEKGNKIYKLRVL